MRKGIAILLGGIEIDIDDCDHDSCKKYGIVCGSCYSAVFYKQSYIKTITDDEGKPKKVKVRATLSHYDKRISNDVCDHRINSKAGREQIENVVKQSRNQRLKLYNKRLWELYLLSSQDITTNDIQHQNMKKIFGKKPLQQLAKKVIKRVASNLELVLQSVKDNIDEQIMTIADNKTRGMFYYEDYNFERMVGNFLTEEAKTKVFKGDCRGAYEIDEYLSDPIMIGFHRQLCIEIFTFLSNSTSLHFWQKWIIHLLCIVSQTKDLNNITSLQEIERLDFIISRTIFILIVTPWANGVRELIPSKCSVPEKINR